MEDQNQRPNEVSNIPTITLIVLVLLIISLLYVGYGYFSDDAQPTKFETVKESENKDENIESEPIEAKKEVAIAEKETEKPKGETEKPKEEKKKLVAEIPEGGLIIPHLVQTGETFFGIANRYNLKADVLRALNPDVDPQTLKVGATKLKVKIKAKHTIGAGDILSVVAKKYDISKKILMTANKLDKDFSKRGDILIIPLK